MQLNKLVTSTGPRGTALCSNRVRVSPTCPLLHPIQRKRAALQCSLPSRDDRPGHGTSYHNSKPVLGGLSTLDAGAVGLSVAGFASLLSGLGFGGGGSSGGGEGNGGGGGGGGCPGGSQPLYDLAEGESGQDDEEDIELEDVEETEEVQDEKENAAKVLITTEVEDELEGRHRKGTKRAVEVVIEGWPEVGALPKKDELKDMLNVQEGFIFTAEDLIEDRRKLELQYDEYIASVDIKTEFVDNKSNHQRVIYKFRPFVFEGIDTIEIKGSTLMPQKVIDNIIASNLPANPYRVDIGLMDKVREGIEKWYQDRGLPFCYVGYFDGMEEGVLRANVIEAKINDVMVRYEKPRPGEDSENTTYYEGEVVPADKIISASGFKKGEHYHIDDGQDAINNIYSCGLIEEINIEPEQDMQDPSKINIKVVVEEVKPKSVEMDLDWAFQLENGLPKLGRQSLIPGGSVEISHENVFGDSQSLTLSVSASDWRNPAQDLGFQLSYTEPFYKPHTTRNFQVFNTRKMSPVFTPGAEAEVPPVFVDRFGAKGWTSYIGGQDDKLEQALILQQITTCDENGQAITKGTKVSRGYYADNGPPTTLSDTGRDVSLSYQAFASLDDVQFVNGNQLGRRALFQVDQGLNLKRVLGFSGGLFNRVTASYTKFLQLPFLKKLTDEDVWIRRKAPNTLVLHTRAGNCIGDMASYDYFALGGPYSVRGYSPGELGACRRFVEAAAEVRVPMKNFGLPGTIYGFTEMGTDLGSSASLEGNPTEYYRKAGRGWTYGVGLKAFGACRFEYARDCNAGTGTFFVNWGERF